MSSLTLLLALVAAAPSCSGGDADIPLRIMGDWSSDDALWLENELSKWLSRRERRLCAARDIESTGLSITLVASEVVIELNLQSRQSRRIDARAPASSDLFRYQVAATAEELVRASWRELKPPRFALFAQANALLLASGPFAFGGGVGGRVVLISPLSAEIEAAATVLPPFVLPTGAKQSGMLFSGTVALMWLPLRLGVFRAGPRASVQVGALSLKLTTADGANVTGITPWVSVLGGVWAGIETRNFLVGVFGEGGTAIVGASVRVDGAQIQSVRGPQGSLGLQAGVQW